MPHYFVYFLDGPCKGRHREFDGPGPPGAIPCGGVNYVLDVARSESTALTYATPQFVIDETTAASVRGKRDVFKAWHRLTHVATHRVAQDVRKIQHARSRLRRAVR